MDMTPEQIANSVLRDRQGRGRGTVFKPEQLAQAWLESTSWFCKKYTTSFEQQCLIIEVAQFMRSKMAKKTAETKAKNKAQKIKRLEKDKLKEKIAMDKARQKSFKFK
ncbi:hypothetical protein KC723_01855 [Candidatus Kaiserbacteria bacterium]|nr:hypothetical protein [Candidatus Kaiserbacteria bacterium]